MSSQSQSAQTRQTSPLVLAALGAAVLATTIAVEPKAAFAGALVFALAAVLAVREASTPLVTWPNALVGLVLIVWLVPIRLYRLPVTLPFHLELYRLAVVLLMLAFVIGVVTGRLPVSAAGQGWPLVVFAVVAVLTQFVNWSALDPPGATPTALKSLSYFLSFLAIFMLVVASIGRFADATKILGGLVVGGVIVALVAIYESRTRTNLFDNLDNWIPAFVKEPREIIETPWRPSSRPRVSPAPHRTRRRAHHGRPARGRARPARGDEGPGQLLAPVRGSMHARSARDGFADDRRSWRS